MDVLRKAGLAFAIGAVFAPMAHVLELPNKLHLEGPLWLAIQQNLYRGWGPFVGAPLEIGALALSVVLAARRGGARLSWTVAACAYAAMLAVFFWLNAPVNAAVAGWRPETMPPDWPAFRLRWEIGHAISAFLACSGLWMAVQANRMERQRDGFPTKSRSD